VNDGVERRRRPRPPPGTAAAREYKVMPPPAQPAFSGLALPDAAMLAALLDHIPARVVVVGLDHRYRFVNREFCAFMGLVPAQVVGRHVAELVGDEAFESYRAVEPRLRAGESLQWEAWVDYPQRGRRYMQEYLLPYAPGGGAAQAFVAFGRDLTEMKLQEESLAEQLARLEHSEAMKAAIVDRALAAIVTTDSEGRVAGFNPAAEAMFGLAAEQARGRPVSEVMIPPRDRAAHESGMRRLAEGGAPRALGKRLELSALRADGQEFPIEMVLWRTDVAGTVHYTAWIVDLSERRRADALIERQREALRQSEKLGAMGSLLAGVAHELNNPLAIVLGRATLLEEKAAGLPALQADARSVREAADRCGRIVRTFLNMARQRPLARSTVQLNELAQAAADILAYGLRSHGVTLGLALDPALPPVQADADQLGQVVLNLLVNAQQALAGAAPAQRHVRLATGVDTGPGGAPQVWLRVVDEGPGVPAALRERVFDPFFTTKGEGGGTGLGLAVSRGIAREHGGELALEDAVAGASFRLTLPLGDAARRDAAPQPPAQADAAAPAARVLVIDDEPEIADLLRAMLEGAGHEVATAETGEVALALLDEGRFDAIVSDLHMPRMDGAELWRAVRQRQPALARRMLFVTGDTLSPNASRFLAEAGCPSLAKPFAKADLLASVGAVLRG